MPSDQLTQLREQLQRCQSRQRLALRTAEAMGEQITQLGQTVPIAHLAAFLELRSRLNLLVQQLREGGGQS
jgi:hypothetical protein